MDPFLHLHRCVGSHVRSSSLVDRECQVSSEELLIDFEKRRLALVAKKEQVNSLAVRMPHTLSALGWG